MDLSACHRHLGNLLPPILGYHSLYDETSINQWLAYQLHPFAVLSLVALAALASIGLWRRLPVIAREAWAVVPVSLAAVSLGAALTGNIVVMARAAQIAMPHIFVGISLVAFAPLRLARPQMLSVSQGARAVVAFSPSWC